MFEHVKIASGLENSKDLPQALDRTRDGAERARREGLVERPVSDVERFDVHLAELEGSSRGLIESGARRRFLEHLFADVDSKDVAAGGKALEVEPRANGNEEDIPRSHVREELMLDGTPASLGTEARHDVEPRRGAVPLTLGSSVHRAISRPWP